MSFITGANFKATAATTPTPTPTPTTMAGTKHENKNDGPTVELAKRPRGRPPGSKNKPKPSIVITRDTDPSSTFRSHVLEIPAGLDVIEALRGFSRCKSLSLCILSCTGTVSDVTLRRPPFPTGALAAATAGTVSLRGRVEVLTLSATVMLPAAEVVAGVAVTVAGVGGQVVGGTVVGPLVAAGTVMVVAAAFERPTFCRLPIVEEEEGEGEGEEVSFSEEGEKSTEEENKVLVVAQQWQEQQHYVPCEYQYVQHQRHPEAVVRSESCGMGIYSANFPTEVIWAPVARLPQHNRPPY